MLAVVLIAAGLLALAAISVTAAHRRSAGTAWFDEYGEKGMGLTVELALLVIVALGAIAMAVIMNDSFESLFLDGGWRSSAYLIPAAVILVGVSVYNLLIAPRQLAAKRQVPREEVSRQCVRPYASYTPFSLVLWLVLLFPVIALLVVSVRADHGSMADARRELSRSGAAVVALADQDPKAAQAQLALYELDHRSAVDNVQRVVNRYLWVVGVFVLFLMVILNTRITSAYAEVAQDFFKWLMWGLLVVAVAICAFGLTRYEEVRDLAISTHEQLVEIGSRQGELALLVSSKEELLDLREEGAAEFITGALVGVFGLVVFTYAFQAVLAKVTQRSAVSAIFPRSVAQFLDGFLLGREEPKPPARVQ